MEAPKNFHESAVSALFFAEFAGSVFETSENLDPILVGVLVGNAGPQRLHVVNRHDAGVEKSRIRWFETLFR